MGPPINTRCKQQKSLQHHSSLLPTSHTQTHFLSLSRTHKHTHTYTHIFSHIHTHWWKKNVVLNPIAQHQLTIAVPSHQQHNPSSIVALISSIKPLQLLQPCMISSAHVQWESCPKLNKIDRQMDSLDQTKWTNLAEIVSIFFCGTPRKTLDENPEHQKWAKRSFQNPEKNIRIQRKVFGVERIEEVSIQWIAKSSVFLLHPVDFSVIERTLNNSFLKIPLENWDDTTLLTQHFFPPVLFLKRFKWPTHKILHFLGFQVPSPSQARHFISFMSFTTDHETDQEEKVANYLRAQNQFLNRHFFKNRCTLFIFFLLENNEGSGW